MLADAPLPEENPAISRAERRQRLLEELTEIGMDLARNLRDGAGEDDPKGRDPADAFARLSRAIRLTIALEAKTDQALADLKAGVVRAHEETCAAAARRAHDFAVEQDRTWEDRVRQAVGEVIDREITEEKASGECYEALDERLEDDEAYYVGSDRPLRETVERICKDLCLTPDWSQWRDEEEGWAPGYHPVRPHWSPFNQPSPRPILKTQGAPPPEAEAANTGLRPAAGGTPAVQAAPGPEPGRPPPPPAAGVTANQSAAEARSRAIVAELSRRLD